MRLKTGGQSKPRAGESRGRNSDAGAGNGGGSAEETPLLEQLTTREAGRFDPCREKELVISFSGGVADCIEKELPWLEFGDLGPILGQTIRESRLCQGEFTLGSETIRATVIGAAATAPSCPEAPWFHQNVPVPAEKRPGGVADGHFPGDHPPGAGQTGGQRHSGVSGDKFPGLPGGGGDGGGNRGGTSGKALICLEQDMAKALGQALALRPRPQRGNPVHRPGEGERGQLSGRGCPRWASPTGGGKDSGSRKIEGRGI